MGFQPAFSHLFQYPKALPLGFAQLAFQAVITTNIISTANKLQKTPNCYNPFQRAASPTYFNPWQRLGNFSPQQRLGNTIYVRTKNWRYNNIPKSIRPNILFIIFDVILIQKHTILLLKVHTLMMIFLIFDVPFCFIMYRCTYRKCAITTLPCKC